MENWSDKPVIQDFKVRFFLDTNILVYLIDGTHSGLTNALDFLNKSEFADLVSSKFVIFEFVGIRKREHYLKLAVSTNPKVNISTLLAYGSKGFDVDDIDYYSLQPTIKKNVEKEIEDITNNFGIVYSENLLHDDLLKPTFDICLASKISKEDSLVLSSSLLPEMGKPESEIHLLSKDESFTKSYNEVDLSPILSAHSLTEPKVEWIKRIELSSGTRIDLANPQDDSRVNEIIALKVFEMILEQNDNLFIGKTFVPTGNGFPNNGLCFKLPLNKALSNNVFITIIAKDLSFIYTTKHSIQEFWQNNSPVPDQFTTTDETRTNISVIINDESGNPLSQEIIDRLRENGNAVYIHPDSIEG